MDHLNNFQHFKMIVMSLVQKKLEILKVILTEYMEYVMFLSEIT